MGLSAAIFNGQRTKTRRRRAPILFNLTLEYVISQLNIGRCNLLHIATYVDEISIMCGKTEEATEMCSQLKTLLEETGPEINIQKKTKKLTQVKARENRRIVELEDNIKTVESFTYLGNTLNTDRTEEPEIQRRTVMENKAYFSLAHMFRSKNTYCKSKIRVYETILRPIVCYRCGIWVITEDTKRKLEVFGRKILRKIFGPIIENGV
ncbi:uncharacterized protein [Diabrotica undecimpunctata]|uniref:uncharacterized protein n=1 Tax=Diabrotica undecimpunctata TaxID=50387 RepID=UPI003B63F270